MADVGGGLGRLVKDMVRDVDGLQPWQCLLQDRQEVIDEARSAQDAVLEKVVMMGHDFHREQPVTGE